MRIDYQRRWWSGLQGEAYSTKRDQAMLRISIEPWGPDGEQRGPADQRIEESRSEDRLRWDEELMRPERYLYKLRAHFTISNILLFHIVYELYAYTLISRWI